MPVVDAEVVKLVQQKLKEKGYVEINEIDGKLGDTTLDVILAFRRRNGLPLVAIIDDQLLRALDYAPPKAQPLRVITATEEHLKPRVAAVEKVAEVKKATWWSKFWSYFVGLPSGALAVLVALIDNFDEAMSALQPVKNFLAEVAWNLPGWVWFMGLTIVAFILGLQAMRTARLAEEASKKLVEGYREGTVKNDAVLNGKEETQRQENIDGKLP